MAKELTPLKKIEAKFVELRAKEIELEGQAHQDRVPLSPEVCKEIQDKYFRDLKTWTSLYSTQHKEAKEQRAFWEHMYSETKITYEAFVGQLESMESIEAKESAVTKLEYELFKLNLKESASETKKNLRKALNLEANVNLNAMLMGYAAVPTIAQIEIDIAKEEAKLAKTTTSQLLNNWRSEKRANEKIIVDGNYKFSPSYYDKECAENAAKATPDPKITKACADRKTALKKIDEFKADLDKMRSRIKFLNKLKKDIVAQMAFEESEAYKSSVEINGTRVSILNSLDELDTSLLALTKFKEELEFLVPHFEKKFKRYKSKFENAKEIETKTLKKVTELPKFDETVVKNLLCKRVFKYDLEKEYLPKSESSEGIRTFIKRAAVFSTPSYWDIDHLSVAEISYIIGINAFQSGNPITLIYGVYEAIELVTYCVALYMTDNDLAMAELKRVLSALGLAVDSFFTPGVTFSKHVKIMAKVLGSMLGEAGGALLLVSLVKAAKLGVQAIAASKYIDDKRKKQSAINHKARLSYLDAKKLEKQFEDLKKYYHAKKDPRGVEMIAKDGHTLQLLIHDIASPGLNTRKKRLMARRMFKLVGGWDHVQDLEKAIRQSAMRNIEDDILDKVLVHIGRQRDIEIRTQINMVNRQLRKRNKKAGFKAIFTGSANGISTKYFGKEQGKLVEDETLKKMIKSYTSDRDLLFTGSNAGRAQVKFERAMLSTHGKHWEDLFDCRAYQRADTDFPEMIGLALKQVKGRSEEELATLLKMMTEHQVTHKAETRKETLARLIYYLGAKESAAYGKILAKSDEFEIEAGRKPKHKDLDEDGKIVASHMALAEFDGPRTDFEIITRENVLRVVANRGDMLDKKRSIFFLIDDAYITIGGRRNELQNRSYLEKGMNMSEDQYKLVTSLADQGYVTNKKTGEVYKDWSAFLKELESDDVPELDKWTKAVNEARDKEGLAPISILTTKQDAAESIIENLGFAEEKVRKIKKGDTAIDSVNRALHSAKYWDRVIRAAVTTKSPRFKISTPVPGGSGKTFFELRELAHKIKLSKSREKAAELLRTYYDAGDTKLTPGELNALANKFLTDCRTASKEVLEFTLETIPKK